MPRLEVRLLGTPRFHLDGKPLEGFVTRKAQALLIYLVCVQRPIAREAAAAMFWPDGTDKSAANNLRRTLPSLRKMVGEFLIVDRLELAFDRQSSFWLDTDEFSETLSPLASSKALADTASLEQALLLYEGAFLESFYVPGSTAFEEWVRYQRECLHELALGGLGQLAEAYIQSGDTQAGLKATRRLLALEPWHESAHRQQMILLAKSGRRQAALEQYELCRIHLADDLEVEPAPETTALYARIKEGEFEDDLSAMPADASNGASRPQPIDPPSVEYSLARIPRQSFFVGREQELADLEREHSQGGRPVIAILGAGGTGKTSLAVQYAHSFLENRDHRSQLTDDSMPVVLWQSLINAPSLTVVLRIWLQTLLRGQRVRLPETIDELLVNLFENLQEHSCLLVLDNLESILRDGQGSGRFRDGFEEYDLLLKQMAELPHRSCLLITSRELPFSIARLARNHSSVYSLRLSGLPPPAGTRLLQHVGLTDNPDALNALVQRYSGSPLALQLVAETVVEIFGGDVSRFLGNTTPIYDDIRLVLDQQFARLSSLERDLLFWLAIEREPVSREALEKNLIQELPRTDILEALHSLIRRSLVDRFESGIPGIDTRFTLQNVVMEYASARLIERMAGEITSASIWERMPKSADSARGLWLNRYALVKAESKGFVRHAQEHLMLTPLANRLAADLDADDLQARLGGLLDELRRQGTRIPGYAGANILHLAKSLKLSLTGWDFSSLSVWQADLREMNLINVDFSKADLTASQFAQTFTAVLDIAYSPDGRYLAAASTSGKIYLWRTDSLQPHIVCNTSGGWVEALAFSPDSELLVAGNTDHQVELFETHTGARVSQFDHGDTVRSVAFSPDGDWVASAGHDRSIRLWDIHTGQQWREITSHAGYVLATAISATGDLASGGEDRLVHIHRPDDANNERTLTVHGDAITSLAYSATGRLLASAGVGQTVRIWEAVAAHPAIVQSLAFHPLGWLLAIGYEDGQIVLWDAARGRLDKSFTAHSGVVWSLTFSTDGSILASGSNDFSVRLWDWTTGNVLHSLRGRNRQIWSIIPVQNGKLIIAADGEGHIRFYETDSGTSVRLPDEHTGAVRSLAISSDGKHFASAGADGTIRLWHVATMECHRTLTGHSGSVFQVEFSPDGRTIASASGDNSVRLWSTISGQVLLRLDGFQGRVSSVVFSPDGRRLAAGGYSRDLEIWDIHDLGQAYLWRRIKIEEGFVYRLAFNPNGRQLAVTSTALNSVFLWDVAQGEQVGILEGQHSASVDCVAFSSDGRCLASGGVDETVVVWDVVELTILLRLVGHRGAIRSLFWLNDETLCSSGADATIRIWDLPSGRCRQTLRSSGPYENMNISGATGLTTAQSQALISLGATEGN